MGKAFAFTVYGLQGQRQKLFKDNPSYSLVLKAWIKGMNERRKGKVFGIGKLEESFYIFDRPDSASLGTGCQGLDGIAELTLTPLQTTWCTLRGCAPGTGTVTSVPEFGPGVTGPPRFKGAIEKCSPFFLLIMKIWIIQLFVIIIWKTRNSFYFAETILTPCSIVWLWKCRARTPSPPPPPRPVLYPSDW